MSDLKRPRVLGRTGFTVGRLGLGAAYGAPAFAYELAFERGCNYFYHGALRRGGMYDAIRNLCAAGRRERLVIVTQINVRVPFLARQSLERYLRKTGLEFVDVLLIGWYNSPPPRRMLDLCEQLKDEGKARALALSGHNRKLFPELARAGVIDVAHVRYNAAHRGAETEVFDQFAHDDRPGLVCFTATRWGGLIAPRRMPPGARTPRASDCYRFVLSHPSVDVCITGPSNADQMAEALTALDRGTMSDDELQWMRKVGDHVYHQPRMMLW